MFLEIKKNNNTLPPRFFDWSRRMELLFTEMGEIVDGAELKWDQDLILNMLSVRCQLGD